MQSLAELPEALTAWELLLAFLPPKFWISPNSNGLVPIGEIHHAAGVKGCGLRQRYPQFGKQALMAAAWLKAGHLGGSGIKGVRATPKGAGAATALVVGFQQHHVTALTGQQRCRGQAGDSGP